MGEISTPQKHNQGVVCKRVANQQQRAPNLLPSGEQTKRPAPIANMIARPASLEINASSIASVPESFEHSTSAESFPLDPVLLETRASNFMHDEQTMTKVNLQQSIVGSSAVSHDRDISDRAADRWQISDFCSAPDIDVGRATLDERESFGPPAASLVSPPASSHDDAGISPINAHAGWKSSTISSRHSSSQPKHMQRYTPESGSMRRASSSSYGETAQETVTSPVIADLPLDQISNPRRCSEIIADEESMRLIKELQAEEYGLRRRGKA